MMSGSFQFCKHWKESEQHGDTDRLYLNVVAFSTMSLLFTSPRLL